MASTIGCHDALPHQLALNDASFCALKKTRELGGNRHVSIRPFDIFEYMSSLLGHVRGTSTPHLVTRKELPHALPSLKAYFPAAC